MNNLEIAKIFDKIHLFQSIKGENPFKISAYKKAYRTLKNLESPIEEIAQKKGLTSIKGIGKGLAQEIEQIIITGQSPTLNELLQEFPASILEIFDIEGIGPKTVGILYNEAGIDSLEDLERAARGGLLKNIKGFGKKTQENIIKAIEFKKSFIERTSLGVALPIVKEIINSLKKSLKTENISETGSLRRREETVKEILVIASYQENINKMLPLIKEIKEIREIKIINTNSMELKLEKGLNLKIQKTSNSEFYTTLFSTTGSKIHVKKVKNCLKNNGYTLKDNKITDLFQNPIKIDSEDKIYKISKLIYFPPEARESGNEIKLYLEGKFPKIIRLNNILGDLQMHSIYSDGIGTIEDMVKKAISLGYSYIALTDHSQSLKIANGLTYDRIISQHKEIDKLNYKYGGKFKIFKGTEVDILQDGTLDYPDEILKKFDFVLASIHRGMKMPSKEITNRIIKAIKHPLVHCLAHPSGRLIGRRREMEIDWEKIFFEASKNHVALEINSHPSRLDLNDKRVKEAKEAQIPILINTDAHSPQQMDLMEYGVLVARRALLEAKDIVNTQPLKKIEKWLLEK